ncbi:MAG: SAP domain-containing protein [Planctomycetaceae bacterium]|nr:SAP domain-containing protein [Planctomycetaceae bacterium]
MFGWLKKDWRKSPAHLLLLSKFRNGDCPERYVNADHWKAALGDAPGNVIADFVADKVVTNGNIEDKVIFKFKLTELKEIAKCNGIKISGRKEDLAKRLVERDSNAMLEATRDVIVLVCTHDGRILVDEYLDRQMEERNDAVNQTLAALDRLQFAEAVRVVAKYESSQVFPRGVGINWRNPDVARGTTRLRYVFEHVPELLLGVNNLVLAELRKAAAMMDLWGVSSAKPWCSMDYATGTHLDHDACARMLMFHASHLYKLQEYVAMGIKRVEIVGTFDGATCEACKKINGKKYPISKVPQLPNPFCTCKLGCRCTMAAIV